MTAMDYNPMDKIGIYESTVRKRRREGDRQRYLIVGYQLRNVKQKLQLENYHLATIV